MKNPIIFRDFPPVGNCKNPSSCGEICLQCGRCGREYPQMSEKTERHLQQIIKEMESTEQSAKRVCEHFQYCGNKILANGEVDRFVCRENLLKYRRKDELLLIKPYTPEQLQDYLEKFCKSHFPYCEDCKVNWEG